MSKSRTSSRIIRSGTDPQVCSFQESEEQLAAQIATAQQADDHRVQAVIEEAEKKWTEQLDEHSKQVAKAQGSTAALQAKNNELQAKIAELTSDRTAHEATEQVCNDLRAYLTQVSETSVQNAVEMVELRQQVQYRQADNDQLKQQLTERQALAHQATMAIETLTRERD